MIKIVLLTRHNAYVGREYASNLIKNNIDFTFVIFGKNNNTIDESENLRCGGLWQPELTHNLKQQVNYINFDSINSQEFKDYIKTNQIDLGIQGDVGEIIAEDIINLFPKGILNFHPGKLPEYRGCSAPEWQIYEGNDIVCTCHYIDKGLDSGSVIDSMTLDVICNDYYRMRASIYPEISNFVVYVVRKYINQEKINAQAQDESRAIYRQYIGDNKINNLVKLLNKF